MYDLAMHLKSSDRLIEALCLLNYLLSNSPSNFHAKLLAIQIYHHLGCAYGAQKMYENATVKFIQLDSLGYLHCGRLPACGMPQMTRSVLEATGKFSLNSYKEGYEYISMCYKYGSFSKLEEFMDFHGRLTDSIHLSQTLNDMLILEIVCLGGTYEQTLNAFRFLQIDMSTNGIDFDRLCDNRDLSVIVRWDPKHKEIEQSDIEQKTFAQDVDLLRIRSHLVRMINRCFRVVTKETAGRQTTAANPPVDDVDDLKMKLNEWTTTFDRVRKANHELTSSEYLVNLLPSRLHNHLTMPYETIFGQLTRMILIFEQQIDDSIETICKTIDDALLTLSKQISRTIDENNAADDLLWNRRNITEMLSNAIEIYAIVTFVMTFVHEKYVAKASKASVKRGKKKPSEEFRVNGAHGINEKERVQAILMLVNRLKLEMNTFDAAIGEFCSDEFYSRISENLILINSILVFCRIMEDAVHAKKLDRNTCITFAKSKCRNTCPRNNAKKSRSYSQ